MAKAQTRFREAASSAENSTSRIVSDVMSLAESLFRNRKDYGAEKLQQMADATRGYAESMKDLPKISEQIDYVSTAMEDFADYVVHTDLENMVSDAGHFARRQPVIAVGIAAGLGIIATRMLMPSRQEENLTKGRASKGQARPRKSSVKASGKRQSTNGSAQLNA